MNRKSEFIGADILIKMSILNVVVLFRHSFPYFKHDFSELFPLMSVNNILP